MRVSPSYQRMAWDQVPANTQSYPSTQGFDERITRHFVNGPTGSNVLYGDGHVKWQRFKDMFHVRINSISHQYY